MNVKFKQGQKVVCTVGTNKNKHFIIDLILKNGYSCKSLDNDGKYYLYTDATLSK